MHTKNKVFCMASASRQTEYKSNVAQTTLSCPAQHFLCNVCICSGRRYRAPILFLPLSTSCWTKMGIQWPATVNIKDRILQTAKRSNIPRFMEAFLIAAWEIWNLRNSKIFDNGRPTTRLWLHNFKQQAQLQLLRVREVDKVPFVQCLDTIT